jgi:formiminoglutamate deiminase
MTATASNTAATTYWCEWAWLGGELATPGVALHVEGERIIGITAGTTAPGGSVELRGLTVPGLANAHSHAFHRLLRSRTHGRRGSFWTWREQMYRAAAELDPERYFALARAVFAEMALSGITTVGEFHYVHHQAGGVPYADANDMGVALIAAAAQVGIRITLLDTCYLQGGIGKEPDEVQLRFSDRTVDAWMNRVSALQAWESSTARVGGAVHSVRAVPRPAIAAVAEFCRSRGMPVHAHVSEQPAENELCTEAYGLTPTGLLADAGAIDTMFTAVHATHLTDGDVRLLGSGAVSVCCCPTTERDLADGVGPFRELVDSGVTLTVGSDSHAVIDLFDEARSIELHQRLVTGERGHHSAAGLLDSVTAAGHRSLGWADSGRIAVGALADFATVDTRSVRMAGVADAELLSGVVFAAAAADVTDVVVGGRMIVRDRRHASIDVPAELAVTVTPA